MCSYKVLVSLWNEKWIDLLSVNSKYDFENNHYIQAMMKLISDERVQKGF